MLQGQDGCPSVQARWQLRVSILVIFELVIIALECSRCGSGRELSGWRWCFPLRGGYSASGWRLESRGIATDFRAIRAALDVRQAGCPFCEIGADRIIDQNRLAVAVRDAYPVSPLHTLVIPRRHANTWFDLSVPEQRAISLLLDTVRKETLAADTTVGGFNVGMNGGEVAGQTLPHAHVIPGKASY